MFITRALRQAPLTQHGFAAFSTSARRPTSSDYGSGVTHPGPNPSEDKEHPGPKPPKPTKDEGAQENADHGKSGSSSSGSGSSGKASNGASPKILNEDAPKEHEQSQEVKEHNEDMSKRADQAHVRADDQGKQSVDKGFWKGHGGVDKDS